MIINRNNNDIESDQEEEEEDNNDDDDDDNEEMIITSKLQLVLAAKSRRLQYTSSPVRSRHVSSLSLLSSSSPDRASVPFSWEEEPGKPKDYLLPQPYNSKRLGLPPRMIFHAEMTKIPLVSDRHRRRVAAFKRWFRRRKERAGDVVFPSTENDEEEEDDDDDDDGTRIKRLHCISDVTKCFFWKVPWRRRN